MTFAERNAFFASMWKQQLSEEERIEYNRRALSEEVITRGEQIKRTLKKVKRDVKS